MIAQYKYKEVRICAPGYKAHVCSCCICTGPTSIFRQTYML